MPVPVLPSPITWTAGQIVTAPQLRADVSDAVAWLAARPMFIGQQTVTTLLPGGQSIPTGLTSATPVEIDTELLDNYNGHQVSNDSAQYFAMQPGYYLCETSMPLNYTGGSGSLTAMIGGVQNGGSATFFGGMKTVNNSGVTTVVTAAKLMQMVSTGTFGSGDYISPGVAHSAGSSETLVNTATKSPYISARWVCTLAGSQPLIVPTNDSPPVPPLYVTSAFMNKNVRDTIDFLIYPPVMEVAGQAGVSQNLASQTSVPATGTTIGMTSLFIGVASPDNYGAWSAGTWTAPVGGLYYAYGQVGLTVGSNSVSMGAGLTVTSANYNSGSAFTIWGGTMATAVSAANCTNVRRRLRLNAGDTISLAGFQRDSSSASATVNTSGFWVPRLIVIWEAA